MDPKDFLPTSFGGKPTQSYNHTKKTNSNDKKEEENEGDALSAFLPSSFGKKVEAYKVNYDGMKRSDSKVEEEEGSEKEELERLKVGEDEEEEISDDEEDEIDVLIGELPISHEARLTGHTKSISALSIDRSGGRMVSGSHDSAVKLWDFNGMDRAMRPFKSVEVAEGHHIHDLQYSLSGDTILVVSSSLQAKLYSREGELKETYNKGDPYIRDMRKTQGHVGNVLKASWHPMDKDTFITSSADSSIRIWKVGSPFKSLSTIVLQSKQRGSRPAITSTSYSSDGKWIAGASQDGAINVWDTKGNFIRASYSCNEAHQPGTDTSSIKFSKDNNHLISRGGDDTLKLFDIRNFSKPILQAYGLPSYHTETDAIFSPNEKLILTGIGVKKGEGYGQLAFLDRSSLEVVKRLDINQSSTVKVLWHTSINQIATGSADGTVTVLFDPNLSTKGAKLSVSRQARKKDMSHADVVNPIMTLYDEDPNSYRRLKNKKRKDPVLSHRPDLPNSGPAPAAKVGASFTGHIMKKMTKDTTRDEDPREALLKYAKIAEEDPMFVNQAYKKTQPKPIFDNKIREEEYREVVRKR